MLFVSGSTEDLTLKFIVKLEYFQLILLQCFTVFHDLNGIANKLRFGNGLSMGILFMTLQVLMGSLNKELSPAS